MENETLRSVLIESTLPGYWQKKQTRCHAPFIFYGTWSRSGIFINEPKSAPFLSTSNFFFFLLKLKSPTKASNLKFYFKFQRNFNHTTRSL